MVGVWFIGQWWLENIIKDSNRTINLQYLYTSTIHIIYIKLNWVYEIFFCHFSHMWIEVNNWVYVIETVYIFTVVGPWSVLFARITTNVIYMYMGSTKSTSPITSRINNNDNRKWKTTTLKIGRFDDISKVKRKKIDVIVYFDCLVFLSLSLSLVFRYSYTFGYIHHSLKALYG